MLSRFVTILRRTSARVLVHDSPNQLAAGFTLGMVLGLVPKGNLIALSLCVLLFSLRMNKGIAIAAAVAFSVFGPFTDAFSHKLGMVVLNARALQSVYASLLSAPLGPWIGFHNTVVAGSLLIGLYLAYPVFWLVRVACNYIQIAAARRQPPVELIALDFPDRRPHIPTEGAA